MARKKKTAEGTPESVQAAEAAAGENTTQAPPGENTTGEATEPKKRSRRKQVELPGLVGEGVEPDKELDALAEEYATAKDARCAATVSETQTREAFLLGLQAKKRDTYEWEGRVFKLAHKDETYTIKEVKAKDKPDYEVVGEAADEGEGD